MSMGKIRHSARSVAGGGGGDMLSPRRSLALHAGLIAALAVLIYSNTFQSPFIFDDTKFIVMNPAVQDLRYFVDENVAAQAIGQGHLDANFWTRKVAYLTFALNYALGGTSPTGYHVVNLLIHIGNGLLVYALVLLTFRTPFFLRSAAASDGLLQRDRGVALFAGLMFVGHPVQTQAVTYLTQRFASLAALFYLLAIVLYIRSRLATHPGGRKALSHRTGAFILPYGAAILSSVLAMQTKEIAFTLPIMIGLYEALFFSGGKGRRSLYVLPFILTLLVIPLTFLGHGGATGELDSLARSVQGTARGNPALTYLFTQFRVIMTYLRLLLLPVGQNIDYDYPRYVGFFQQPVFLSFLCLLLLFSAGVVLFLRSGRPRSGDVRLQRLAAFGIFWFFLALSVESSFLPLYDLIFEHRLYLPSVGMFLAALAALGILAGRLRPEWRKAVPVLLVAVVVIWSSLAYARNAVWGSKVTAWEDTVRKSPGKARPHSNLGMAYLDAGRYNEAVQEQQRALSIDPNLEASYRNLSLITGMAKVFISLGTEFMRQGRPEEAAGAFRQAAKIEPRSSEIQYQLGSALEAKGDTVGARAAYEQALKLEPRHTEARIGLGRLRRP